MSVALRRRRPAMYLSRGNTPAGLKAAMLANSPWGLWMMDEASGSTFADSSGNGRSMTLAGTPDAYATNAQGGLSGVDWPVASASGSASGATNTGTTGNTIYSAHAWFYLPVAATGQTTIFTVSNGTTNYIDLSITGGGCRVTVRGNGTGSGFTTATPTLTIGAWHLITGFFDFAGTKVPRMRVDKVNYGGAASNTTPNNNSASPKVHTGPFTAGCDMVVGPCAYYLSLLADTDHDAVYNAGI